VDAASTTTTIGSGSQSSLTSEKSAGSRDLSSLKEGSLADEPRGQFWPPFQQLKQGDANRKADSNLRQEDTNLRQEGAQCDDLQRKESDDRREIGISEEGEWENMRQNEPSQRDKGLKQPEPKEEEHKSFLSKLAAHIHLPLLHHHTEPEPDQSNINRNREEEREE
jgi:phage-related minor tail protein